MSLRILYQDEELIGIDKPSGFHVHPPEDTRHRISKNVNCLHLLREQVGQYLFPVHRLDRATSGVLVFALNSVTAKKLCQAFENQKIKKVYYCVVRGWTEESGLIDHKLKSDDNGEIRLNAETRFDRIGQIEVPISIGKFKTARYSLLRVIPKTGRKHQIRRHLEHIAHPLIGDTIYGKSEHNRIFREYFNISGLLLKAYQIEFVHPTINRPLRLTSRWCGKWHRVFDLFGVCPSNWENFYE